MGKFIALPKVDVSMEVGVVAEFYVKENDVVSEEQNLFLLESDKGTDEIKSTVSGTVIKLLCAEGDELEVGTPVMFIGEPQETMPEVPTSVI